MITLKNENRSRSAVSDIVSFEYSILLYAIILQDSRGKRLRAHGKSQMRLRGLCL